MLFIRLLKIGNVNIELRRGSILIVVGPNNGGKTTVLREIMQALQGADCHKHHAVKQVDLEGTDDVEYMLKQIMDVGRADPNNGILFVRGVGTGHASLQIEEFVRSGALRKSLGAFALAFCEYSDIATRLTLCDPKPSPNFTTGAKKEYHVHFLFDKKREEAVATAFEQAFSKPITLVRAGSEMAFYFGDNPAVDVSGDRSDERYIQEQIRYPKMMAQGDGMKAYLATLMVCHATNSPIKLIDEPCAVLHPPQARTMGKDVLSANQNEQRVVSTHSSELLKGVLAAEKESSVQVVRISRDDEDKTAARLLTADKLEKLWGDPTFRYSNLPDALFHDRVVLCEDDTDCRFYCAMRDAMEEGGQKLTSKDVMYASVGGKGGLARAAHPLHDAGVDVRCVADIDVLEKPGELKNIVAALGGDYSLIDDQIVAIHSSIQEVPMKNVADISKIIARTVSYMNQKAVWSKSLSDAFKKKIRPRDSWSKIKREGKRGISSNVKSELDDVLKYCLSIGLHIVPVGEVESFCRKYDGHSRYWLEQVLNEDLANSPCLTKARDFVRGLHQRKM